MSTPYLQDPTHLSSNNNRLEEAARAGWLYYVAHNTQDEIAKKMGVSRQSAQRLVSTALKMGLIKIRLEHPVAHCMQLAQEMKDHYQLSMCEVSLTDPTSRDPAQGIAQIAAAEFENYCIKQEPQIIALGTGREVRTLVDELSTMHRPQHRIVSLVGNLAPDGSANDNDPLNLIGDVIHAKRHPLSVPVIADSATERNVICQQKSIRRNFKLAAQADVAFVGIGELNDSPPLLTDGFITQQELIQLQALGAVGEIVGWSFNEAGQVLSCDINNRVSSVQLSNLSQTPVIGVARGKDKIPAILAALKGKFLSGLITDEDTARALLS